MANENDLLALREKREGIKKKTNELVSKDAELFANLTKSEITEIKKNRAKKFRSENSFDLKYAKEERYKEMVNNPDFKWTKKIADEIIDAGLAYNVLPFNKIKWLLDKDNAMKLIADGHQNTVLEHLDSFEDGSLDEAVALKSLGTLVDKKKEFSYIVEHLNKFNGLSLNKDFALKLINHREKTIDRRIDSCFAQNIDCFTGLDKEVALQLLTTSSEYSAPYILDSIDKFDWLKADADFANKIINANEWWVVVANPEKFEWFLLNKDIALKLIEQKDFYLLLKNLSKFTWLDKDIAFKIIESCDDFSLNQGDYTKPNLWCLIVENADLFKWLEANDELAEWLIDHNRMIVFNRTISKFKNLDKNAALKFVKRSWWFQFFEKYARYFNNMDWDVAVALMDSSEFEATNILGRLKAFWDTTSNKIAHYLKERNTTYPLTSGLSNCTWLDAEIKQWLIDSWKQKDVDEYPQAFA